MPSRLEVRIQPAHALYQGLVFWPALECCSPEFTRFIGFLRHPECLAKMRGDFAVGHQFIGAAQIHQRFFEISEPKLHPAHAVDEGAIIRLKR